MPKPVCGCCERPGHETKACPHSEAGNRIAWAREEHWEAKRQAELARVAAGQHPTGNGFWRMPEAV